MIKFRGEVLRLQAQIDDVQNSAMQAVQALQIFGPNANIGQMMSNLSSSFAQSAANATAAAAASAAALASPTPAAVPAPKGLSLSGGVASKSGSSSSRGNFEEESYIAYDLDLSVSDLNREPEQNYSNFVDLSNSHRGRGESKTSGRDRGSYQDDYDEGGEAVTFLNSDSRETGEASNINDLPSWEPKTR